MQIPMHHTYTRVAFNVPFVGRHHSAVPCTVNRLTLFGGKAMAIFWKRKTRRCTLINLGASNSRLSCWSRTRSAAGRNWNKRQLSELSSGGAERTCLTAKFNRRPWRRLAGSTEIKSALKVENNQRVMSLLRRNYWLYCSIVLYT